MENENKVAVISIIVESGKAVDELNALLHGYWEYIIGRMGIPYKARGINIISVALDAPRDTISTLAALARGSSRSPVRGSRPTSMTRKAVRTTVFSYWFS